MPENSVPEAKELPKEEQIERICSWCLGAGNEEVIKKQEKALKEGRKITHGMCPDCERKVEEELEEFKEKNFSDEK